MALSWEPMDHMTPLILCLRDEGIEFARVGRSADDRGWCINLARHRPWERQLHARAPTQAAAMKWAERWVRANWQRCLEELPELYRKPRRV